MKLKECSSGERKEDWYYRVYDEQFARIQDTTHSLLEIGVQFGGSLLMWERFFPNATIEGFELEKQSMISGTEKFVVHYGDQADPELLKPLGMYDIIIDDGGHTMNQQLVSFEHLWSHVNSGGCYVIEDLHTSYWGKFRDAQMTTIDYLKTLVDSVNSWATNSERSCVQPHQGLHDIESLHFYKSMAFIWKG